MRSKPVKAVVGDAWEYVPCVECGFWVPRRARHCPNCGRRKPQKIPYWLQWNRALLEAVGRRVEEAAEGGISRTSVGEEALGWVFCGVLIGLVLGAIVGIVFGAVPGVALGAIFGAAVGAITGALGWGVHWVLDRWLKRRWPDSLQQREALLHQRLLQISLQVEQFRRHQQQLEQRLAEAQRQGRPTKHLARGLEALKQTQVALEKHAKRLRQMRQGIALRRWQNGLIPFVESLRTGQGGEFQPEVLQEHIDEARSALAEAPEELRGRWYSLIEGAERLHDALLLRLATEDVRRVRPLEALEVEQLRDLVEPLLEEVGLEEYLMAWGEKWEELEGEYQRLTGEMEAVEEVEQLVDGR